ncbi:MAG TPA: CusA/CzcA family heavy metal efflux RND transporter [Polyangiaceae bacterium]|nr:CusA/CzcA family heavy metal efflux RND transporter [Polyangiaceae bacterium]
MLSQLIAASIRLRVAVLGAFAVLLCAGVWAVKTLPVDALPDVSTIQVSVLTTASGLTPREMERAVTIPIENALNGVPGGTELRSVSRAGLSAVTVVFSDRTDVWFARQLVLERIRGVPLPSTASSPELSPVSTGLGEIYQFVVRSDMQSPMQLRTLLDWEIVPRLRGVPGVIEVNTAGGDLKQFQVVVDPVKLGARHLTLGDVVGAVRAANLNVGGGYVERDEEAFSVRGQGIFRSTADIENVVLRTDDAGIPVLVKNVADVRIAPALRYGVITQEGKREAVTGIVMMLLGANSRDVVHDVARRVAEIRRDLPPGVSIDTIYDRSDFVGRTLSTVTENLLEGIAIVVLVLIVLLGTLRGAIAVVLGIPGAMSVALLLMHAFGVTGDLMSLGAIDFGFLVDGPIVVLEAVIAQTAGRELVARARAGEYSRIGAAVARPVAFAVAIIMLVYVPLLSLEGVEGKMFKPMAITMASALLGALVYTLVFFPALLVTLVPPPKGHGPRFMDVVADRYTRLVPRVIRARYVVLGLSAALLAGVGFLFVESGAEFVPRIFEGDAVVTIRRAPSISLQQARKLDLQVERVLHEFPEVVTTLAQTGRAEVAVDPVGNDNTDVLVHLTPISEWSTAHDFDDLSEAFKQRVESRVPSTFVSVSQPIEDRTNELISGSRADVQIQIFGDDLDELTRTADDVGAVVKRVRGAGDVRIERILGQPLITASVDRERMARFGVRAEDALTSLQSVREGVPVGTMFEGQRQFEIRVLTPPYEPTAEALGEVLVAAGAGRNVPLREVASISEGDGPASIRRQNRERAVRVDVNLRGRDLVSWVGEARARVAEEVALPASMRIEWGGQFENFARAQARLAVVVPVVVLLIFGMLMWMFEDLRLTLAVFSLVPLSLTGGMIGLLLRGLSFSLPAAVGFIALGGIGVLNGVVIASAVRSRLDEGRPLDAALAEGTASTIRAVLTTAAVASLGFFPMALATGAGAEVQRPLATAVVVGMFVSTALALVVLPGVLSIALRGYRPRVPEAEAAPDGAPEPAE